GRPAQGKAGRRVRSGERLAEAARERVADGENPGDQPGPVEGAAVDEPGENHEQQQSFECGLVELAGVTRERPAVGKLHGPRRVAYAAPQFAVDEVGDAAEKVADRIDRAAHG